MSENWAHSSQERAFRALRHPRVLGQRRISMSFTFTET